MTGTRAFPPPLQAPSSNPHLDRHRQFAIQFETVFEPMRFAPVILDTACGRGYVPRTGDVAQLGERRLRKSEVEGSNPFISILISTPGTLVNLKAKLTGN